MPQFVLPSFAKINWILKILGKRPDGFHELRTVLQTVSLCDRLTFEARAGGSVELLTRGRPLADDDSNLVCRAAAILRPRARNFCAIRVTLHKRIPLGAGLGGGSSNAAVTLLALNQLWECGLGTEELMEAASQLGSDVPFFLMGGRAAASGRGEILSPIDETSAPIPLLLLYPGMEISAAHAYSSGNWKAWDRASMLTSERVETTIQRFCQAAHSREGLWAVLENDFEAPLYQLYPALRQARDTLMEAGCGRTLISGSGSTILGLPMPGKLRAAYQEAARRRAGELFQCRTLSRQEYRQRLSGGGLETE